VPIDCSRRDVGTTLMIRYVDATGREWLVRELVDYDSHAVGPDGLPTIVRSCLVFESAGEHRVADDAPLNWREYDDGLAEQFARALRLPSS
jgi:hypothetical protein